MIQKIILSLILLMPVLNVFAQKEVLPVKYRFRGGGRGLVDYLIKTNSLPESEIKAGIICNSITKVTITPGGGIKGISIFNPVDSIIDSMVLRSLKDSGRMWKACDTINNDQSFYIQIAFTASTALPNLYRPEQFKFKSLFPDPVIITIPEKLLRGYPAENKKEIKFIKNEFIADSLNKLLEKEEYKEALPVLNELITRDPFSRDLYKVRIMINFMLGKKEQVMKDDERLMDFAGGYSLVDLLRDR